MRAKHIQLLSKTLQTLPVHQQDISFFQSIFPIIPCSGYAERTVNPIRQLVEVLSVKPNPRKPLLKLHLGDPTITGALKHHPSATEGIRMALEKNECHGYPPAYGLEAAREAVAEKFSTPNCPISPEDVTMTNGCSHALQMAVEALADVGQNILVPRPGYPLGDILMKPLGIEPRGYRLDMDRGWEADLDHLRSLVDRNTVAIVVNNPSNPSGAVYSKEHLENILKIAEYFRLPIIADEIYGDLTYDGAEFHPMASLSPKVPVLTCDGIGKRYLVPGWRMGWLIIHDHQGRFEKIRPGIQKLTQKLNGPCALIQGAIPHMLKHTPESFFEHTKKLLSKNSATVMSRLSGIPGIRPIRAFGAMYTMIAVDLDKFHEIETEKDFIKKLIEQESLYVLPSTMFGSKGSLRVVISHPEETIKDACERLQSFCYHNVIDHYPHTEESYQQLDVRYGDPTFLGLEVAASG